MAARNFTSVAEILALGLSRPGMAPSASSWPSASGGEGWASNSSHSSRLEDYRRVPEGGADAGPWGTAGARDAGSDTEVQRDNVSDVLYSVYNAMSSGYISSENDSEVRLDSQEYNRLENQSVGAFSVGSRNDAFENARVGLVGNGDAESVAASAEVSVGEGGAASSFIGALLGFSPRAADDQGSLPSRNSSSIFRDVFNLTLDGGNETFGALESGDFQGLLGLQGAPYFSAYTHNGSHHGGNSTSEAETLFANYPPLLLDFAVFCCVLFIVLGVPGNLITIVALVKCKKVHNATAVFIINLTLSDLMFGVFNLPLAASLFGHRAWVHTGFLCQLFPILRYGLVAVSVFTVLAITINRYVMIAHPRLYHKLYTRSLLTIMVLATWAGAFGALVPTLLELWGTFGLDEAIGSCTILPDRDGKSPKVFLFVFAFVLPCVAICVCYARIFCIVHRADKKSHGATRGLINGKRRKRPVAAPPHDPPTLQTLQTTPLHDRLQLETLVKLSTSRNSVRVEIVEPGEKSEKEKTEERNGGENGESAPKEPARTPSPLLTSGDTITDASSLLKTEVNGFSGQTSEECAVAATVPSPIRVCPPTAPSSPASERSEPRGNAIERRPSTISGFGGTFSHLRGTFRKTRAGSFIARQPDLSAKDRRLLKMILVIFISFVLCYLPITLIKTFSKDDNPVLNIVGLLLIYMTTCINPIIYVVMSSEYRQAYVSLLTCRRDTDATNRSVTKIS